jgi:hypothetical protein|tara:strand:+ start:3613 stop:3783 length:171 start_codon:yes stop_codon:yes gene_type:complete
MRGQSESPKTETDSKQIGFGAMTFESSIILTYDMDISAEAPEIGREGTGEAGNRRS